MIPLLVILEILILCLGATVFLYRPKMMVSEAICSGIIVALLTLSCLYQTVFLIGIPQLAFIFEGMLMIASLIVIKRRNNYISLFKTKIIHFYQHHKITGTLLGIGLIYLLLQTIILPPTGPDFYSYHLPRVLLFQQEQSLFLENVTTLRQAVFPVGWNMLTHSFLRFYTDYSIGIFNFLVYLAITSGIYALARQISSQQIAIVTTLAVITMPQIVLQSNSLNTDSPLAAIAIFSLLILSRLYNKLNIIDFNLLILVVAFGISIKLTFLLFLAPFMLFGSYLLLTKYSLRDILKLIVSDGKWLVMLIFPVFIFSQVWLYIHNYNYWGGWSGPPDYIEHFTQTDGLRGTIANSVRYIFESIDLMQPTDIITDSLFNVKISNKLVQIYRKLVYPFIGHAGMLASYSNPSSPFNFDIEWRYVEGYAWYGILGFLLAIPSIVYTLIKGKQFPRIVSLILIIFFAFVSYKVAWSPWRGRYFSVFFVLSSIPIAYTLHSTNLWLKNKLDFFLKAIIIISLITFFITSSANEERPIFNLNRINYNQLFSQKNINSVVNNNIWVKTEIGTKREHKRIADALGDLIPSGSTLGLLSNHYVNVYDYLLALPHIRIIPIHPSSYINLKYRYDVSQNEFTKYTFPNPLQSNPESFDYFLCLDVECRGNIEELSSISRQLIWDFKPSNRFLPEAQLFKLN